MGINFQKIVVLCFVGLALQACQPKVWHHAYTEPKRLEVDDRIIGGDAEMDSLLAVYRHEFNASMNEVMGTVERDMVKSRQYSALLNWFADAVHDQGEIATKTKLDIVVQNYGGIRLPSLAAGPLTRSKIFELMPFENKMLIFEMTGSQVKPFLDRIAASGGWAINGGNAFKIQDKKATEIIIAGEPFDLERTYTLGIPDFIALGGDGVEMFQDLPSIDTGLLIRDLLLDHVKANPEVKYNDEGRITN